MNLTKDETVSLMKFSAISFAMDEYFGYSMETLMKIRGQKLVAQYRSKHGAVHSQLNRTEKKIFEKYFLSEMDKYSKQLIKWKSMTSALRDAFESSKDSDHNRVADFSIDLIHRALDKFEVTADNEILVDKVKDHIFESLDKIKTRTRTEEDANRLIWAFDNFLVKEKLV